MNTIVLVISGLTLGWFWWLYRDGKRSEKAQRQEVERLCQEGIDTPYIWDVEAPPSQLQRHVQRVWAKHPEDLVERTNLRTTEETKAFVRQCEALVEREAAEDHE